MYLVALIRQAASDQPGVITHATPLRRILANNVPEKFNNVPLGSAQEARGAGSDIRPGFSRGRKSS